LVQGEVFEGRKKLKLVFLDPVDERPSLATDGAIARSDVAQIEGHFEAHATAMA
jgi:hypothetical protein